MWRGVRGGYFGALEGCFADDFGGGGEARMGGFTAKFRGFRAVRVRGAAIQRTADRGGHSRRKNF